MLSVGIDVCLVPKADVAGITRCSYRPCRYDETKFLPGSSNSLMLGYQGRVEVAISRRTFSKLTLGSLRGGGVKVLTVCAVGLPGPGPIDRAASEWRWFATLSDRRFL